MKRVVISGNAYGWLRRGGLWVFANEVRAVDPGVEDGDIVDIVFKGRFVARGYCNFRSTIAVRVLTFEQEAIDQSFWLRRLESALVRRRHYAANTQAYRLVFSEGDMLPGLIVDIYNQVAVIMPLTLGIELRKHEIIRALDQLLPLSAVVERADTALRKLEGLLPHRGILRGKIDAPFPVEVDGLVFFVDPLQGQKTGLYLDQRLNRQQAAKLLSRCSAVLDVFSYVGGFGLYALAAGAQFVEFVEQSSYACQLLDKTLRANGFAGRFLIHQGNAFELLRQLRQQGKQFDAVILDPPAFAKTLQALDRALRGYKDINIQALRLLSDSGVLVSCSCSQKVSPSTFEEMLTAAAEDCKARLSMAMQGTQPPDHPVNLAMPQTHYLKCYMCYKL